MQRSQHSLHSQLARAKTYQDGDHGEGEYRADDVKARRRKLFPQVERIERHRSERLGRSASVHLEARHFDFELRLTKVKPHHLSISKLLEQLVVSDVPQVELHVAFGPTQNKAHDCDRSEPDLSRQRWPRFV